MKAICKLSVLAVIISIILFCINDTGASANEIDDIDLLIYKGMAITDNSSSEAYVWVNDVMTLLDKYQDMPVYSYAVNYCKSAKSNYLNYDNAQNRIFGSLMYIKAKLNNERTKTPMELIGEAEMFSETSAPEVYKWAFDVLDLINTYPDSSVYNHLKQYCNSVKNNYLTYDNAKNRIVADLTILDNEIPVSHNLQELIITKSPDKACYFEGDCFEPKGIGLQASFSDTYKDGSVKTYQTSITTWYKDPIAGLTFDTTTPLKANDSIWAITYTCDGQTVSTYCDIKVIKSISAPAYDNKVVSGNDVKKAIKDFSGQEVAILVNNLAFNGNNASAALVPAANIDGITASGTANTNYCSIAISKDNGVTQNNCVTGYATNGESKPSSTGVRFVNYNAVLKLADGNDNMMQDNQAALSALYRDDTSNTYIFNKEFHISSDGNVQYYIKTAALKEKDSNQYISDGSTYQANLIKTKSGNTIGFVFIQLTPDVPFAPELCGTSLDSIFIASQPKKTEYLIGETFNAKGLKVNAKYANYWSDGSITYTTTKNVKYTVDTTTTLSKKDKTWAISFVDRGKSASTNVKIKVKSSDPKINKTKLTLTPGESFQLKVYGTEKYVLWKCDGTCINLDSTGMITAKAPGTAKVTATIGSGKKNVKITCTIKVKQAVASDKTVIFLEPDEYETIKIKVNKKGAIYKVISDSSNVKIVDEGNNTFDIVPNVNSSYSSYSAVIQLKSYAEEPSTDPLSLYNAKNSGYVEQEISVFVYGTEHKSNLTLSLYSNGFYFGEKRFITYEDDLWKQFKKYAKSNKKGSGGCLEVTITKENFEKIMKKAIKDGKAYIEKASYYGY